MSLADLRDLVIIIWGVAGIVALILAMVLAFIIFSKVMGILNTVSKTVASIHGAIQSLTKAASFATGLRKGFEALDKLRRRRKEGGGV